MKTTLYTLLAVMISLPLAADVKRPDQFTHLTSFGASDYVFYSHYNGSSYDVGSISGTNLASGIGSLLSLSSTYQPLDSDLTSIAALSTTSFGRSLLTQADASATISTLGLASLYQPLDATLTALAGLSTSSGKMIYATGTDTFSQVDSTSFGRSVLNTADAAALRTLAGVTGTLDVDGEVTTIANAAAIAGLTNSSYISLTNQVDVDNYRTMNFTAGGVVQWKGKTGGGTESLIELTPDYTTVGTHAIYLTNRAVDTWVALHPTMIGQATKVLAVNATEDGLEWVASGAAVGDITGLGTGVATWLATPSSSNLAAAVTGETGTGALVFGTSPDFTTGATIGGVAIPTISSTNTLTNKTINGSNNTITNISLTSGVTGTLPVANGGTGIASLGTGVATWLGTPSLANLNTALGATLATTSSTVTIGSTAINVGGSSTSLAGITGLSLNGGVIDWSANSSTTPTRGIGSLSTSDLSIYVGGARNFAFGGTTLYFLGSSPTILLNSDTAPTLSFGGSSDVTLTRDGAARLQLGTDAASPTNQGLKAADGSGTNKTGAALNVGGGQSTGTGRAGHVIIHTGMTGSSTGSSLNSYTTRAFYRAGSVTLTESTATLISNVAVASGKIAGGTLVVTVNADDGTDFQALTSTLNFSIINKGGTVTATVTQTDGTTAASSGTLSATYTIVVNGNSADIKCNAVSSLTQTTLAARVAFDAINSNNGDSTLTSGSIVTP